MSSGYQISLAARRHPLWKLLSLEARGVASDLFAYLDTRGRLQIGPSGLRGLALLLGCQWSDLEPPIRELLEVGLFTYVREEAVLLSEIHGGVR